MTKKTTILSLFVLAKFLVHFFLVGPEYELHRDEFLHLDQAHHLAWGFMSIPPFTSWISAVIIFLGGTLFWAKTLFIMGSAGAKELAQAEKLACAILDYKGGAWISTEFKKYLHKNNA